MSALFGRPKMLETRTPGLTVGWKQGLHERAGTGTIFINVLGEAEYEFTACPKSYYTDMLHREDPENLMNSLMVMYLGRE